MNKMKVMTIVGTRPEIIRLSEIIKKMDIYFEHILVHTGQNWDYTLNQVFFDELGIREPDFYLNSVGDSLGETMGNIIAKSYGIFEKLRPEALLILGDTNSALSAISAKRLKIPIFHMEAGNRCFDQNLPEEINRKIVDHIADVNLPYTEHARRYLISEGYRKEHIFVTGSPLTEVINTNLANINNSEILENLNINKGEYILVSAHREENIDNKTNFFSLMSAINEIAEYYQMPVIYSTHPRSEKHIEKRNFKFHPLVRNLKPFGYFDYNKLQLNAFCVLSDSGTVPEEASILGFPAVSIRTSTERPESLDKGAIILGGIRKEDVLQSVLLCRAMWEHKEIAVPVNDYIDTNISTKVIKIIQSYTKIINKVVWGKE
ncbi:UDP-N-acetyl glucosamine 2-epimerase [Paenibacillus sp. P3E]|uniref:non-hydrolyzing UDP-N-acetylglucosamine 2-epimerase n=1 Tax=Paenibacillus sp. P3E TaxID=1349435 RepID=UPI00093F6B18|nr:UDP-N-acetylglucosamine 2-epimerase (non-hydrolyzing) [Paenibacillus sp. P3E]OKP81824.1 UDP-N-acetyl glucosamine 2-epimerase [Paenibacillus sp. P3E]